MIFLATCVYVRGNLLVRLATQRRDPAQVCSQVQLASTCDYLPVRLTRAFELKIEGQTRYRTPHLKALKLESKFNLILG